MVVSALILGLGALLLSSAWGGEADSRTLSMVGMGAFLLIAGAILVGPLLAGPSVRTLGFFLPRLKGVTGKLATENAARAPKRTAATAAALLIAVALIGFVAVFAESAKASVESEVNRGFTADLFVQPEGGAFGGMSGFGPEIARTVGGVEGVDQVAAFGAAPGRITYPDGDTADTFVGAVDPAVYGEMATPDMTEGELTDLQPGGVIVDESIADDNDLTIGSEIQLTFPGGATTSLTVDAISDDLVVLSYWTIHPDDYAANIDQPLDFQVMATVDGGSDVETVRQAVEGALEPFPGLEVLDRDGFIGDLAAQLSALVNVIIGLLLLSIIIAMIGVANTLSLSVYERTRELGLLRAVGMAKQQISSAIRWEAVVIAALGTLVGLALGMIVSFAMIKALEGFGLTTFAVPIPTILFGMVLAAALAVVASLFAVRRAGKLDILAAIAHE
jgi:putative ABC transport system permease protein